MTNRILFVDDDPNVLQSFKRHLRKNYELELAVGGKAALEAIQEKGPFAVVVSDMQMPEISGVELLKQIREISEHTVRVMLTGNADQKTAVDAVNEGSIFRFLNKPCAPDELALVLDAGLEHYRLVTAEAELLNKTLAGSVKMLIEVLSLTMPKAFGTTRKARTLARAMAEKLDAKPLWQIEIAAMLTRVGCVSLPPETLSLYLSGEELDSHHAELVSEIPMLGHCLITEIPRLEGVAELILAHNGPPDDSTPMGARILRVVNDYQRFDDGQTSKTIKRMEESDVYDQRVVQALSDAIFGLTESKEVPVSELRDGMVLKSDIVDLSGRLLVAGGLEIHAAMIQKLALLQRSGNGVREPLQVYLNNESDEPDSSMLDCNELSPSFFQGV